MCYKKSNCPGNGDKNNEVKNKRVHLAAAGNDDGDEFIAFNSSIEDNLEHVWFLDSGATNHMTNDEGCFLNKTSLDVPKKIRVAKKGVCLEATGVGSIEVFTKVGEKRSKFIIKDVLFVRDLSRNLLSVQKI